MEEQENKDIPKNGEKNILIDEIGGAVKEKVKDQQKSEKDIKDKLKNQLDESWRSF